MEIESFFLKNDMNNGFMADQQSATANSQWFNASGSDAKREEETAKAVYNTYPDTDDCQKLNEYVIKLSSEMEVRRKIMTSSGASINRRKLATREFNAMANRKTQVEALMAKNKCGLQAKQAAEAAEEKKTMDILEQLNNAATPAAQSTGLSKKTGYIIAGVAALVVVVVAIKIFK